MIFNMFFNVIITFNPYNPMKWILLLPVIYEDVEAQRGSNSWI